MQFTEGEVCRLITACKCYQEQTGSEYMYDEYERLIHKLNNYGEEYSPTHLQCELDQQPELNHGTRHNARDSHSSASEQSGATRREASRIS